MRAIKPAEAILSVALSATFGLALNALNVEPTVYTLILMIGVCVIINWIISPLIIEIFEGE